MANEGEQNCILCLDSKPSATLSNQTHLNGCDFETDTYLYWYSQKLLRVEVSNPTLWTKFYPWTDFLITDDVYV